MKHGNLAVFIPHLGCPHCCSFCNQRTISGAQDAPTPGEAAQLCEKAVAAGSLPPETELAFFGGSFTAIPMEEMCAYLAAVQPYVGPGKLRGIRLSTRPDAINRPILALLRHFGVTAVELGAQSLDDRVLALNGRGHSAQQLRQAVSLLREQPFELGLQWMPGLYGDTKESIQATAEGILELRPDSVRVYPTLVLEGTELARLYRAGRYKPLELEEAVELCAGLLEAYEARGIQVLRLGLHPSPQLEEQLLAGPYHPAFGQLCRSRLALRRLQKFLATAEKGKAYHLYCAAEELSTVIGQGRQNALALAAEGYNLRIKPLAGLRPGQFRLEEVKPRQRGKDGSADAAKNLTDPGL